jgi:hypothetical protein
MDKITIRHNQTVEILDVETVRGLCIRPRIPSAISIVSAFGNVALYALRTIRLKSEYFSLHISQSGVV